MLLLPVLASFVARAEPYYGWQIVVPDAAGFAVGAAADRGHLPGMSIGTIAVGVVAGPTVHWAHGRVAPGVLSVVGWSFVPPVSGIGALLVNCIATEAADECARQGDRGGTLLGAGGMVLLDSLVLPSIDRDRPHRPSGLVDGYGWQILAVDGAGFALGVYVGTLTMEDSGDPLDGALGIGAGMYAVGLFVPPIVHAVHGGWSTAGADIALRWLGPPLATVPGMMAWCSATGGAEGCVERGLLAGLAISSLVVSSFDAQVLARSKLEVPVETTSLRPQAEFLPQFSVRREGVSAGIAVLF